MSNNSFRYVDDREWDKFIQQNKFKVGVSSFSAGEYVIKLADLRHFLETGEMDRLGTEEE